MQATQVCMYVCMSSAGDHARVRINKCAMMIGHVSCRNPVLRKRGEEVADGGFPTVGGTGTLHVCICSWVGLWRYISE